MITATSQRQPELTGQIVVVTGLGALHSAAFDAAGPVTLERRSGGLPGQAGHVMVTAAGPAVR